LGATPEQVRDASVFRKWLERLRQNAPGVRLERVYVEQIFRWGGTNEIRMLMLSVEAYDQNGKQLDRPVFLRGDTVCVVPTLYCNGQRYGVLISQLRVAGAQDDVLDWASGMIDHGDIEPKSAALRELLEETGTTDNVQWKPVVNLGEAFTGSAEPFGVSEGGTDEGAYVFWAEADVEPTVLDALQGAQTGVAEEGEELKVVIAPWREVPRLLARGGRPCGKAALGYLLLDRELQAQGEG